MNDDWFVKKVVNYKPCGRKYGLNEDEEAVFIIFEEQKK